MSIFTHYYFKKNISKELQDSRRDHDKLKKELEDLKEEFKKKFKNSQEDNIEENKINAGLLEENKSNLDFSEENKFENGRILEHPRNFQTKKREELVPVQRNSKDNNAKFYGQAARDLENMQKMYSMPLTKKIISSKKEIFKELTEDLN
mmetsp:Transcript_2276/g.1998  ORF Transcript_2276/g.1998 Transcript_2276/m.1998 type:complete len:149 (+) Transcript_2276:1044-1490(+)